MSIDDDKKRQDASIENTSMKKVKIKNESDGEQKKKKQKQKKEKRLRSKTLMLSVLRKGWVNIMRKNHLKFTQKKKRYVW